METVNKDSSDTEHLMVGGQEVVLQLYRNHAMQHSHNHCTVHTPAKVSTDVRYVTFKFEYIIYNFNYRVSSVVEISMFD